MNKYSKQKLNKRNKNTAKQAKRISTKFDIYVNKASSPISNQIFYRIYAKVYIITGCAVAPALC